MSTYLVVVLTPGEDLGPMGKVVGDDGQPVPPRLDDSLHVVQRVLQHKELDHQMGLHAWIRT